jgi:MFS family permease
VTSTVSLDAAQASPFRYRGYALFWTARFVTAFAFQIVSVAVGWHIYDTTRDPFLLGLVGLVQFLPSLALVLVTGTASDRWNRRIIMGLCIGIIGVCSFALVMLTLAHSQLVWPIFAILTVVGVARAFLAPAVQSLAPNLVPAEVLSTAIAYNSSSWQIATIVGPVVGGLLYGISSEAAFGTATLGLALAFSLTLLIPKPPQKTTVGPQSWDTLFAGFRYVWSNPIVLGAISLDLFAVLLGGATALLPVFARDILDVGPIGLGMLRAAPGIGAIAMAVWLVRNPIRDRAGVTMFAAVVVFGICAAIFGVSTSVWLSVAALIVMGAADMISVNVRQTLIQLSTPDEVRGRVNAVSTVSIGASNELGEFRAGTMASLIGAAPAVVLGGMGTVLIAGLWARWFPQLRTARRIDQPLPRSLDL